MDGSCVALGEGSGGWAESDGMVSWVVGVVLWE
ncbi:hypothetical protein ABH925_002160 [Streptacidiphilus sp. EB129]